MPAAATVGSTLKRAILLRRYENQLAAEVNVMVAAARERLVAIIAAQDLTAVSAGRVQARLDSIAAKADEVLLDAYQRINALTRERLVDLGEVSGKSTAVELQRAAQRVGVDLTQLGLPNRSQLRAIIASDPIRGDTMGKWWQYQRKTVKAAFRRELQIGLTQNEGLDALVRRIRGRAIGAGRYEGGVMEVSRRQAESLVRTSITHIYNRSAEETYRANPDLVQEYEIVAVLDARTTEICAALDGKVFKVGEGRLPPFHWGCRTTIVPIINYRGLGVRAPEAAPRQTYAEWFGDQSAVAQDEILGPARAGLIRSGKADLLDLVRQDGSKLTLQELTRKLEAA